MLIDIPKATDIAKSNSSKECVTCCYCVFNHGLNFQYSVFNGCHNLMMFCLDISNIVIVTVKCVDYCLC